MFRYVAASLLAAFVVLATTAVDHAADPNGAPPADSQVVKSTPTKVTPASSVQFRKDLSLPLHSLSTIGSRIDAARRTGDPVALAHAANELSVAEKVSGKTASLTSKHVLAEAGKLASLRRQQAELKSVLTISDQVTLADEQVAELKKLIAMNQAQTAAIAANEEPKPNVPRKVVINNYTTQYIDVQVNGYLRGQVLPGTTKTITIDQMWNPITLKGWGDADETIFGPVILQGQFGTYTWNINGNDGLPNQIP